MVAPALAVAARSHPCVSGAVTAESYTWNFPEEASGLLNNMRVDADQVADHAAKLETFARNPQIDWQLHADQLHAIKQDVNDMGKRLCRLETIQRVSSPSERSTIHRVAPLVQLMADNTEDAINYVNAHQGQFWTPTYRTYARNLYTEANVVSHRIHNNEALAKLNPQEGHAGADPGVRS